MSIMVREAGALAVEAIGYNDLTVTLLLIFASDGPGAILRSLGSVDLRGLATGGHR